MPIAEISEEVVQVLSFNGYRLSVIREALFGRKSRSFGCLAEFIVERTQTLRDDSCAARHRHEIMIARPSRHDVKVQMRFNAGPSHGPEVPSDIEPLSFDYIAKETLCVNRKVD
jgi:hypothetical protein